MQRIISTVIDGVKYSTMIDPNNDRFIDAGEGLYGTKGIYEISEDTSDLGFAIIIFDNDYNIIHAEKIPNIDEYISKRVNTISHLLTMHGKVLTDPISKVLNGVTYTAYPNSVLISSARDPYQGTFEVYCVIGTYEDVTETETGPAIVFYGNDGEICYGVKLKDKYLHDTLNAIYDGIFNGFDGNIEVSIKSGEVVNPIADEEEDLPY